MWRLAKYCPTRTFEKQLCAAVGTRVGLQCGRIIVGGFRCPVSPQQEDKTLLPFASIIRGCVCMRVLLFHRQFRVVLVEELVKVGHAFCRQPFVAPVKQMKVDGFT